MSDFFVEEAKRILSKYKYHVTTFLLYVPGKSFEPIAVTPADREENFLLYRRVAHVVREICANALICIAEVVFRARRGSCPGTQPVDSSNRI